jgi:rare lipoprotein A
LGTSEIQVSQYVTGRRQRDAGVTPRYLAPSRPIVQRVVQISAIMAAGLLLANCGKTNSRIDPKYGVAASERVIKSGEPVPKGGGTYRVGKPYVVAGRTYVPKENANYRADGIASWYGDDFHGRKTANGEIFDMTSISAAHPTLPIPSYARVTNLKNKRSLIVRINDRGPFAEGRIIDLSTRAAKLLDFHGHGLARVRVEYVGKAPLSGSSDAKLEATLRENGRPLQDRPTMVASVQRKPKAVIASANPDFTPDLLDATPIANMMTARSETAKPANPVKAGDRYVLAAADDMSRTARPAVRHTAAALPEAPIRTASAAVSQAPSRESLAPRSLGTLTTSVPSPVSAYAAPRYDGSAGLVSGRGLY